MALFSNLHWEKAIRVLFPHNHDRMLGMLRSPLFQEVKEQAEQALRDLHAAGHVRAHPQLPVTYLLTPNVEAAMSKVVRRNVDIAEAATDPNDRDDQRNIIIMKLGVVLFEQFLIAIRTPLRWRELAAQERLLIEPAFMADQPLGIRRHPSLDEGLPLEIRFLILALRPDAGRLPPPKPPPAPALPPKPNRKLN